MKQALRWTAAAVALGLAGCNPGDGERNAGGPENVAAGENAAGPANAAEPANAAAAAFPCLFTSDDVRDWKAVHGKDGTRTAGMIVVTGQARVANPRYRPELDQKEVEDGVLRLRLAQAENDEEAPAGGWHDLKYGPGESGISRVVIWCDVETALVDLAVE